jgi:hypothetical protein
VFLKITGKLSVELCERLIYTICVAIVSGNVFAKHNYEKNGNDTRKHHNSLTYESTRVCYNYGNVNEQGVHRVERFAVLK